MSLSLEKFPPTVYPLRTFITFLTPASLSIAILVRPIFIPFPLRLYVFFVLQHFPLKSRLPQVQENMLRQLVLGLITRKGHLRYKDN
jgi:hypothetical protein